MSTKSSSSVEPGDDALTTREAARILGVAVSTTQLWMERGALPSWKTPGGHRRCRRSEVLRLITSAPPAVPLEPAGLLAAEFHAVASPSYPVGAHEAERLRALAASGLVDSPPEHVFDRLAWLAAQFMQAPMAVVSLLTAERQWFKARSGVAVSQTPRAWAFCSHAVLGDDLFVVEDAQQDARFCRNPLVRGQPHIRFYAGLPVHDANGYKLGTLCVLDTESRTLTPEQGRGLLELGNLVTEEIRRRA